MTAIGLLALCIGCFFQHRRINELERKERIIRDELVRLKMAVSPYRRLGR